MLRIWTIALAASASVFAEGRAADITAAEVAARLLAHMEVNRPVAGEFEMRTRFDPEIYANMVKSNERANSQRKDGTVWALQKPNQLLLCRWAWDGKRQMTETLPGSRDIFVSFMTTPEAFLEGYNTSTYNILEPRDYRARCPGSFYPMAANGRWDEYLGASEVAIEEQPPLLQPGTIQITARHRQYESLFRIIVEAQTGIVYSTDFCFRGKLIGRMECLEFSRHKDGRVFPSKARVMTYHSQFPPDRPQRIDELIARRVVFPVSKAETDAAFAMTLPAGATITDRMLDKQIVLERPTNVRTILEGKLPSKPMPIPTTVAPRKVFTNEAPVYWLWFVLASVVAIAVCVLLARRHR